MSLAQINDYGIGNVNLTSLMDTLDRQRRGYQAISLTHYDDALEPKIAAGSIVEIGGALFKCESDESISGWAGIGNDNDVYIKLVPSGTTATAAFTTAAPTWSTSKQGWYVGNDRYIAGLYKDAGGNYTQKHLYRDLWKKLTLLSTGIKIGYFVRTTAGNEVITDVGFQPSVVIFLSRDNTSGNINISWGFDDGTIHINLSMYNDGVSQNIRTTESIYTYRDSSNNIIGLISALSSNGFTVAFTLTGSCGTTVLYLCLP